MIKVADIEDFAVCLKLLEQLGSTDHITAEYLYLDNPLEGFTVLVFREDTPVAMSTFSIRRKPGIAALHKYLYWENLIVDKHYRDGLAYLSIRGYIRKLIKLQKYDDVYFVVRRKHALQVHKSAKFKTFGYLHLVLHNVDVARKQPKQDNIEIMSYPEFCNQFCKNNRHDVLRIHSFNGFEYVSERELIRQLSSKRGTVLIDNQSKNVFFLRNLIKFMFVQVNLIIPGSYEQPIPDLAGVGGALININLCLLKFQSKQRSVRSLFSLLIYEALNLSGKASLKQFQIWEHDAW